VRLLENISLSRTAVFEWHSCFKTSQVSVEDDECSGQPSTSKTTENVEKIHELFKKIVAKQSMSSYTPSGSVNGVFQDILTENLNMRRIAPS
jgi:hypothetical protein